MPDCRPGRRRTIRGGRGGWVPIPSAPHFLSLTDQHRGPSPRGCPALDAESATRHCCRSCARSAMRTGEAAPTACAALLCPRTSCGLPVCRACRPIQVVRGCACSNGSRQSASSEQGIQACLPADGRIRGSCFGWSRRPWSPSHIGLHHAHPNRADGVPLRHAGRDAHVALVFRSDAPGGRGGGFSLHVRCSFPPPSLPLTEEGLAATPHMTNVCHHMMGWPLGVPSGEVLPVCRLGLPTRFRTRRRRSVQNGLHMADG